MAVFNGSGLLWVRGGGVLALEPRSSGGILGDLYGTLVSSGFGEVGGVVLMLAGFLAGMTLLTGLSWLNLMDKSGTLTLAFYRYVKYQSLVAFDYFYDYVKGRAARKERVAVVRQDALKRERQKPPEINITSAEIAVSERAKLEDQESLFGKEKNDQLPELSLLDRRDRRDSGYSQDSLTAMSRQVELKLDDFGIEVKVVSVQPDQ